MEHIQFLHPCVIDLAVPIPKKLKEEIGECWLVNFIKGLPAQMVQ